MSDPGHEPVGSPAVSDKVAAKRSIWGRLIALVIVAVLIFAVISGIRKSDADKAAAVEPVVAPTVVTATARRGAIGFYVQALGTVTPLASVNLYSQVNGRVMAVHYREGQMVHRGDALIDIDPRPYQAQLKEAQGTLQHDKGLLMQAEMDLSRYKEAADAQAIARQTYEDQKQVVEQYRGTVQNDTGQVEYAQVQLSYCHLTSPIDGRVGLRLLDPGNTVFSGASNPIVVVTQLVPISVVFNVAEDDLGQVRNEITHRARLLKTLQNAILIPTAAVQRNGTQAFVYVLQPDNTVKIRQVVELTTENDLAAVTGLNEGEVVSTTGFEKLQDGTKVKVQSSTGAPVAAAKPAAANEIGNTL
jgi:multidrug efflux system membrane fusion protein